MTRIPGTILPGLVVAALVLDAPPARADALDGNWCHTDGRRLSIQGPNIVTPGGTRMTGDYRRHSFHYTVPAGEPGAGQLASIVQLHELAMQYGIGEGQAETWNRCGAPTS